MPNNALTRDNLYRAVATRLGITNRDARKVVSATFEEMHNAISSLHSVSLRGFGSFDIVKRSRRFARSPHPKWGNPDVMFEIPPHNAVRFTPCTKLKREVIAKPLVA